MSPGENGQDACREPDDQTWYDAGPGTRWPNCNKPGEGTWYCDEDPGAGFLIGYLYDDGDGQGHWVATFPDP